MHPHIDEAFLTMSELIETLSDLEGHVTGLEGAEIIRMEMEAVELELPLQLDITVSDEGEVIVGGVPPLYYVETTVLPVFHQLRIALERNMSK